MLSIVETPRYSAHASLKVSDIMTRYVCTLKADQNLEDAIQLMEAASFRHLPIVDNENNLVGIISHRDVLNATISSLADLPEGDRKELYQSIPLEKIMTKDVMVIHPELPMEEAAGLILVKKIGSLPVVDDSNKLVGIITESDFVKLAVLKPKVLCA